jgi:hypothetical protein
VPKRSVVVSGASFEAVALGGVGVPLQVVRGPQGVIARLFSRLGDVHYRIEGKAVLGFYVDTNAEHAGTLLHSAAA